MKYLSFCLSFIMLFTFYPVRAVETMEKETLNKYNLIDEGFESPNTVTRFECLAAVMKAAGVNEDINDRAKFLLYASSYHSTFNENAYFDGSEIYTDPVLRSEFSAKYVGKWGYVDLAFNHGIAKGEMLNGQRCFFFDRFVTAKEAVTFMLRCIEDSTDILWDEVYLKAKERGLIKESDVFYNDEAHFITPDEFCVLLYRFLNQQRYIYFIDSFFDSNGMAIEFIQRDEERSMTYLEYLILIQEDLIQGD